ncbi:MAG: thioredoxin family protein [Chitinispirillia bacterium]|nr:thioredoxin family protein [Chitinispirillia bacterium]
MMKTVLIAALMLLFTAQIGCAQDRKARIDNSEEIADRIVESKIPVFVDFWASWCGACRMLEPVVADLHKEYKGRVEFIRVDVDVHKAITAYFGVTAMPTVFIVEDKTARVSLRGLRNKQDYRNEIDKVLAMVKERAAASAGD